MNNDVTSSRGTSSVVEHLESIRTRRNRRRKVVFAAFLVMSLAMGSMWALGFADATVNQTGGTSTGGAILGQGSTASTAKYTSTIVANIEDATLADNDVDIAWNGLWGGVGDAGSSSDDETIYKIDLTGETGTFYLDIYNTTTNAIANKWSAAQLEFRLFQIDADAGSTTDDACLATTDFGTNDGTTYDNNPNPPAGSETTGTFTAPAYRTGTQREVVTVDAEDAYATFPGLVGGQVYCVGIPADDIANTIHGTFLRRPTSGASGVAPSGLTFTAVVNKSAN